MRDMLAYKHWTRRFIILAALFLVLSGLTVFIVDPLQHYRRATFYRPFWECSRYYDPGFAKHYDYDCIIIGTSMVANFVPSEVGRMLSVKVLLASINSAYPYEEYVLLDAALRTGKVKAVIWGMDIWGFRHEIRTLKYGPGSMPFYLYDDNPFNDYQYLLNGDVLLHDCFQVLAANLRRSRSRKLDADSANFWGDRAKFTRDATLASMGRWRQERPWARNAAPSADSAMLDMMERSFDSNVLSLVKRYPDVRYYIFLPPYSILYWTTFSPGGLQVVMDFKRHAFRELQTLSNAKLFDFQDLANITLDLDSYMDYLHYPPDVSKFIIDAISKNQYLVTDDNVEEKISRLESQTRRFTDSLDAVESTESLSSPQSQSSGRPIRQDAEDLAP